MSEGWIRLHRQIQDCEIWDNNEPYDYRSAWIYLLLQANHRDKDILFDKKPMTIKRGQYLTSVRKLAEHFRWGNAKTLRFLRTLESLKMINKDSDNSRTLLTIVNYDIYQCDENTDGTQTERSRNTRGTLTEHSSTTNKNVKNDKNEKNNNIPLAPSDLFIQLMLNDGSVFEVSKASVSELKELYPSVDVEQELRNMKGWLNGNPSRRKTRTGINRFINSWLAKEQNKGGSKKALSQNNQPTNSFNRMVKNDYDFGAIERMLGN